MGQEGSIRVQAAIALALAAIVAGGCGGSDDGGDDPSPAGASADEATTPQSEGRAATGEGGAGQDQADTPVEEIGAAYDQLLDAAYAGRLRSACGFLSTAAQKASAAGGGSCETAIKYLADPNARVGGRPEVVGLRQFRGDRAVAVVQVKDKRPLAVPFVREQGEWKVDLKE